MPIDLSDETLATLLSSPQFGLSVVPRTILVSAPAAGADWTQAVAPNVIWWPQSIVAVLTTSATVITRYPNLQIFDGTTAVTILTPYAGVAAGAADPICWARGGGPINNGPGNPGLGQTIPLPNIPAPSGYAIRVVTTNLQVADTWTAIALYVLEVRARDPYEVAERYASRLGGQELPYVGLTAGF